MDNSPLAKNEPTKLWNRNYILILLLSVCNQSASQMVDPIMNEFAKSIGADLVRAGTITAMMSIAALFFRPIAGFMSDRFSRKKIIIVTTVITAISMLLYSFTTSVNMLMTVRFVHGIVFSFTGVALMAFNTMFIPKDRLGEGMGWMAVASILSQSIGPMVGTWCVENVGYHACFWAAAVACVLTSLVIIAIPYEKSSAEGKKKSIKFEDLLSLRIMPFAILMGLFSVGNGLVKAFLYTIGKERSIENIAIFFTAYSVAMFCTRPFVGKLLDKKGIKIIMYPAYAIAAVGMVLLGRATALWMIILAGVLKAIGQGSGAPSIQAHSLKLLGREKAGVVSSTLYIGQDIGNAAAPVLGSFVVSQLPGRYDLVFYGYAALLLVIGWGLFFIKSRYEEKKYGKI